MKKRHEGPGWYYTATTAHFGGIFWSDEHPSNDDSMQCWGPFKTFGEAKRDAIGYFQTDIDGARLAIQEIRSIRKPRRSAEET